MSLTNHKETVRALLESHLGTYQSGQQIADQLHISRAAVWKCIQSLRQDGIPIAAVPNKGYALDPQADLISSASVQRLLTGHAAGMSVEVCPTLPSTNTYLKARAHETNDCAVIALTQTAGRGRRTRTFYSPPDTGLYLSVLLHPKIPFCDVTRLTVAAAVAAADAVETICGQSVQIKWVNDLWMDGRKIGGILTEASLSLEDCQMHSVIVGIGMNLYPPAEGFPEPLKEIAGAVMHTRRGNLRTELAAGILNRLTDAVANLQDPRILESYRKRCFVLGQPITVVRPDGCFSATALALDEDCRLIVRYDHGQTATLSSEEIQIRPEVVSA